MDLTPEQRDELLAAWALDALDDEGRAALDRLMADDPSLAVTAEAFTDVIASLAEPFATPPPAGLRDDVLTAARSLPRPPGDATSPLTLFEHQVAALDELATALTADDWHQTAEPYEWTVQQLLAHLGVIDRYTARQLGLTDAEPDRGRTGHLVLGEDEIAAVRLEQSVDTVRNWRQSANALIDGLRSEHAPGLDAELELHGWPFRVRGALIARAFETWTHTDDIRRAVGHPLEAPSAADLRAMSQFSVATLPLVYPMVARSEVFTSARVVLTGEGGGTYDLGGGGNDGGGGGDGDHRALVVVDVEDYCRIAARRLVIDDLELTVEGDEATAHHLLAAAQVFAI